jgi:ATP-dependent helicase/nuclease subunit B
MTQLRLAMPQLRLSVTAHGRPAAEALRDRVAAAKADDPLAPVTVLVPTNYVGVSIRRLLATGALGPVTTRGVGIAGLSLLTVYRLAELLGAPDLDAPGRRHGPAGAVRGAWHLRPGGRTPLDRAGARPGAP